MLCPPVSENFSSCIHCLGYGHVRTKEGERIMVYLIALFKTRFSPRSLLDLKKQELIFALPVLSTPTLVEKKKKKRFP